MGTFFTNLHVRATSTRDVDTHLKRIIKGEAYRSKPEGGWISIYDETTESQDLSELQRLAEELSSRLQTVTVAFLVHDSDTTVYFIHDKGELVDHFTSDGSMETTGNSAATDTMGDSEAIRRYGRVGMSVEAAAHALRRQADNTSRPYPFEEHRVREIADLLGINSERACAGFNFIAEDAESLLFARDLRKVAAARPKSLRNPILQGDTNKVRKYLETGADPNEGGALDLALCLGRNGIVHLLLDGGANLDAVPHAQIIAATSCDPGVVARIFEMIGANAQALNEALLASSGNGRLEVIELLLFLGAEVNSTDFAGVTPLMSAASWRHADAVRLLLDAGADPASKDAAGRTAADFAGLPLFSSATFGGNGDEANVPRIIELLNGKV